MKTIAGLLKANLPTITVLILLALAYHFHALQRWLRLAEAEEAALLILLGTALLWVTEAIPLYVTSLGVLLLSLLWLYPILEGAGVAVEKGDFYQAFFGDITLLFMGGFVLSALLNKYGLARRLANWMIRRTGTAPPRVLAGIIAISALLSMWMSNTATAAMMFAIISPVLLQLPKTSPFSKGLALAIPFACNIGGLGTPIGTPPNAIAIGYLEQAGIAVSFSTWMLIAVPVMALLLWLLWWLLLRSYPPGSVDIKLGEEEEEDRFSIRQYLVIALFLLAILGWLSSGLSGLSTGTVGLLAIIAAFGSGLLTTPDFRNISWDILFMLGGGLCLGVALNKSGLTDTIAQAIPVGGGFYAIFGALLLMAATMTTVMSNTATANLLIPVAVSLPGNELVLCVAISIMCSSSMALPVSTPPNAIAFGSGLLPARDMFHSGLWITVFALAATILASIFYLPLFL
ncbi:MAG: SLC13/DASS family transporter [Phaeodactylibacter sp.]|nr:SLC13/DASS family transporter [Phaeodactylibacter sp.]